ncbi:DoxX family protein [Flavobacterium frigoris]|uniref:DoxX-like family protein n=1 Tax=Flavobacterium frigoris (strain PS1) TaxID=1086011 RepID=H7FMH2_FLAFP|nr:DoxX family protein [Flavobacterium frigoris]EIA10346.1 hypothetical protein HJ01_00441 [Flavobacterium frigoris PS1]
MKSSLVSWILRVVVATILLQTLYFKFTGADESIYIFSILGMEPYGRIGSGVAELIASILILIPRTTLLGALIGLGIMAGAILSHLLVLGIEVQNDRGVLFIMALISFLCCSALVYQNKNAIPNLLKLKF